MRFLPGLLRDSDIIHQYNNTLPTLFTSINIWNQYIVLDLLN